MLTVLGLVSIISACKTRDIMAAQLNDSDMTIQVIRLSSPQEDSVSSFKARIIPRKTLLDNKTQEDKDALIYRMDSCFYIGYGNQKVYASLVQPVANGTSGSFEFLLEFANASVMNAGAEFIYQDKYLNRKKYNLRFTLDNH